MAITAVGESQDFGYTGNIQSFKAPFTGLYKLEVYGGKGGTYGCQGGNGGYSVGYKVLTAGTTLYVVCGAQGNTKYSQSSDITNTGSAYNGGGIGYAKRYNGYGGYVSGGGGATHIATASGVLSALASNKTSVLIVAGGGGGATNHSGDSTSYSGGSGGGATGGNGSGSYAGKGGTQTAGGTGYLAECNGAFGKGGNSYSSTAGNGGGAGWYGGAGGYAPGTTGAGGSGYIGGVPAITFRGKAYSPSKEDPPYALRLL